MPIIKTIDRSQWTRHFVKTPVILQDGRRVFWTWVERRYVDVGHMWAEYTWQYRATEETK